MLTSPAEKCHEVEPETSTEGCQSFPTGRLNEQHYQHCVIERQLAQEWIEANCRSLSVKEATQVLKYRARSEGILLEGANGQCQFRPDHPWPDKDKKTVPKYRTAASEEYDALVPVVPQQPHYWLDEAKLKQQCWQINGHPYLVVTEGAFKAIAACSEGVPTIALLGVEMGLTSAKADPQGKRYLVPTLEAYAKKGLGFILAFDADISSKPSVKEALYKLGSQLKKMKVPVAVLPAWDEALGKGIDDYLVLQGIRAFRTELLGRAIAFEEWAKTYEPPQKRESKPAQPDQAAKQIVKEQGERWLWNNEQKTWMVYELKLAGVWQAVDDLYISVQVKRFLDSKGIQGYGESYLKNIVGMLKRELYSHEWSQNQHLLPFTDCVLNLKSNKTLPHSQENRLTWVLPRCYQSEVKGWPKIEAWLTQMTQGKESDKRLLLAFAAAVLRRRSDLQKFLHLIGTGGSGKSTFMNLLIALVGEQNTLSLDLETLNERDALAELLGKILVVCPDQDSIGRKLSNFKKLTGQDLIRGRRLYQDGFNFRFEGMCVISSNKPIFHAGTGRWLTRRALMVPFEVAVAAQEVRPLEKEFEPELAAFTNYLLSLEESQIEATLKGLDKGSKISSTLWEAQLQADGLASWVNEHLIYAPGSKTQIGSNSLEWTGLSYNPAISTLFGSYCLHCRQTNRTALTKENFSANLLELLGATLEWQVGKKKSNGIMHLAGVRLRTEADAELPFLDEQLSQGEGQGGTQGEGQGNFNLALEAEQGDKGDLSDQGERNQLTDREIALRVASPLETEHKQQSENLKTEVPEASLASLKEKPSHFPPSLPLSPKASPNVSLDYSTYPHRTSNALAAQQKRALALREKLLACGTRTEIEALKEVGYSANEIEWVSQHLTQSEKNQLEEVLSRKQLNWWDNSEHYTWEEVIAGIDSEMKRLGWTQEQGRDYLKFQYKKRSRHQLSDLEVLEFWNYLKRQRQPR